MAGVSAGTGAMGSLIGKLAALLGDEYKLLTGVRKQIEFLERELSSMRTLLDKLAGMGERLDGVAKDWRGKVRDLSYDIEDCIDRFMDRLGDGDAKPNFMKRTARRLRTLWARHDIATQIKELKARVVEESERRNRYRLDESFYAPSTRVVEIDPRITALHGEVRGLVAMDSPTKHVTALLTDDKEMELKVVAIVGSGGLGKTTLAMEVYRRIAGDFHCRASVSVSRTLDLDKLLKDILSQIDEDAYRKCKSECWEIEQLIRKTKLILTGKRYFIVIDDVWNEQDWNLIKATFPDNNNGSRVIATTRITGVAKLCCSNSGGQPYHMPPLDDYDSRRLFFKRIFCSEDSCPADLEEVSARILKKCGGLPLAIITFASLLANKTHTKDEWERLQDSIGTGSSLENDGNLKGMKDILLLSYWDLPHHLKTCLLYLCIYPEDYKIKRKELKWKWIAEGFLAPQWGHMDQVAEDCFNELVNRNLIQPVFKYDGSVRSCRVHDMVFDLIISLSIEENFAAVLNGHVCNSFPRKIRRLSMQSGDKEYKGAAHAITETKLHVRSLTMFRPGKQIPHLVDFHVLRVLDLKSCDWLENKHVRNIGSSRQLRYLRIESRKITELPGEIGKLRHLETLDLRRCSALLRLPSTVVQLLKLVRLFVSFDTVLPAVEFGSMDALEEVDFWNTDDPMRFAEELRHLTKLRKLRHLGHHIVDPIGDFAMREKLLELLVSSVSELAKCNLKYLVTDGKVGQRLFRDLCCTYPYLHDLAIHPHIEMIPKGMTSLRNLVKLDILVEEFDKEGLHVLMDMRSLSHLRLEIRDGMKENLTIGNNGFKVLKVFLFRYRIGYPFKVEPADLLQLTFAPAFFRPCTPPCYTLV
nr:disease resistance protein PIK6-NP-like isoform X2 [Lolium perenne]